MLSLHFCTSDSWGGLEVYTGTLVTGLRDAGEDILAICAPQSKLRQFLNERGVRTVELPDNKTLSLASFRFLRKLLRREKVGVIHVHFHKDIWLASAVLRSDPGRKLFLSIYMGVGRKKDLWHRWVYRRVDGVFSSSKALNEKLPDVYPIARERIHYLPYGRILDTYAVQPSVRAAIRERWNIGADDVLVGSMVRLDPGKGVLDFLQSFLYLDDALRRNVHFLVVGGPTRKGTVKDGESPYEPRSEKYYQELLAFISKHALEGRIHLAGYQPDLIGYLSAMDIFVFPSRDEMYSLAVLDAMAMQLPVVAARAGGNLLQIDEGHNGLLYAVADSKDLACVLMQYLRDPDLRIRHGRAARAFVEQEHSMERVITLLREHYQR